MPHAAPLHPRATVRRSGDPLPWLLAAQATGLWLADAGLLPPGPPRVAAVAAVAAAWGLRRCRRLAWGLVGLSVAAASGDVLAGRLERAGSDRLRAVGARTITAEIGAREIRGDWIRLELTQVAASDGGPAAPRAVRLEGEPGGILAGLRPGDRLRARVALEPPAPRRNPGGPDVARTLARRGVGAIARPVDPLLVVREHEATPPRRLASVEALRARAGERLSREGPGGELLRALACGARAGLSPGLRRDFGELGLAHVLSVSGLHLVLVAGLAFAIAVRGCRLLAGALPGRDSRRPALVFAVLAAGGYAVFSGFEVPVQRSLAMVAAASFALARRRPFRARSALVAAAAAILAAAPEALFDAGAQMSFAASAALLALRADEATAGPAAGVLARIAREGRSLLSASAAAAAATAPLAATHLGVLSPAGLVANLVFVPVTGLLVLPAALLSAGAALAPPSALADGLVSTCAALAALTCDAVSWTAARLPDPPPVAAPRASVLLACALLALAAARARGLSWRIAACLLSTLLLALASPAPVTPEPPRAVFLDVGQGDATLVQGRGGALLLDAGLALAGGPDLGRSVVLPALAALGVGRLDVLAVSHADADHAGGAAAVLETWPVGELWLPAGGAHEADFEALRRRALAVGVPVRWVDGSSASVLLGDLRITPLAPPRGATRRGNDGSLVLRVEAGGASLLLPGDVEAAGERALLDARVPLASDVLKLAHHGSATSSAAPLLSAVAPRFAVASAACGGRFGMPHPEVVARLEAAGIPWAWTGRDGAVIVPLHGNLGWRGQRAEPARCTPGGRRASGWPRRQRPTKRGGRFSTKARCASRASSVRRSGRPISSWRR